MTNFAILGTGMVADYHRRAIEANAEIGAGLAVVGHHDPTRFDEIAETYGVRCLSLGSILEDSSVDAVILCTPSGQHAEQAIACAAAGKHVLVEKPMALSLEDADRMIAACDRAGVLLGVVLQRRAELLFQQVHAVIEAGDLGELTQAVVTMPYVRPQSYFDSAAWRGTWALDGGGVLMNQGSHLIDLLVWYMGDPIEVAAFADTLHRQVEVEDTLAASLRFENGALGTITATTTAGAGFPHRLEIFGTRGGIQIEGESIVRWDLTEASPSSVQPFRSTETEDAGSGGDPKGIALSGHTGIVRDFVEAVRENRPPLVHGLEGRRSLSAILAIYNQAWNKRH